MLLLLVAVGGFLGATARFGVNALFARCRSDSFPWATFVVNIAGSFLLGLLTGPVFRFLPAELATGIAAGFLGALTTFSTFMYDSLRLLQQGKAGLAMLNLTGSIVVGLLAAVTGWEVGRQL